MQAEILTLIKEKLPSIHAKALGEYFTEAEATEKELTTIKAELETTKERLKTVTAEHEECRLAWIREQELDKRESEVLKREQKADLFEQRFACETEKVSLVKEMFFAVFKNTQVRKSVMGNTTAVHPNPDSYSSMSTDAPHESEEIITEE